MKNILVVQGGGPEGNTVQLTAAFIKGAQEAGRHVEIISLATVEIKGCMGCNTCSYGKPGVIKDGYNKIAIKIKAADLIVFASPRYFWIISARIKAFIERFFCIAKRGCCPAPRAL